MKQLIIFALVCLPLLCACGGSQQKEADATYKTLTVTQSDQILKSDYTATLRGRQYVEIRPQVSGIITRICINEGDPVHKGQTLFIIDQVAIIADQRKFVSALIVPVYGFVKEYAKEKGIEYKDMTELLQHPKIVGLFRARIDTLQQQFAHYEQIKRFTLLPEPFSMERGELTNTLKLKRAVVAKNYSEQIEKMYEESEK